MSHVCPWWIGYVLAHPLRRFYHDPAVILGPFVRPGMTVLEIGPGMGYFSLPLAGLVGPGGRVVCADVQERMLRVLRTRAEQRGLLDRIETRVCRNDGLGVEDLNGRVDFVLAFAVVHEIPDAPAFFRQVREAIGPGAKVLFAEPKAHVSAKAFARSVEAAEQAGLRVTASPDVPRCRTVVLEAGGR